MTESEQASPVQKVGQDQIHGLLFSEQLSWQAIIYDLINTEQLDPWDIDLSLLSQKFLEKVRALEEANFFISSKVLFAASLLLRMKSEILLERDIEELDAVLFGRKEEARVYKQERIELEEEIPELMVRTPLPRFKKVTLEQLMRALDTAIKTETRRIQKVVLTKQQEYETALSLPKRRINIQDSIASVYQKLEDSFINREEKLAFSEFSGSEKDERIATFIPLLHLDNQHKVWLEQTAHGDEIWILLKHLYEKQNAGELEAMKKEVEEELERLKHEEQEEIKEIEKEIEDDEPREKEQQRYSHKEDEEE
ncbi:segregation/condensation protein A [Candidatus Pacearchaeota archaeon]|nr:segregation/condensation protein A [Candidatus Pacearchaeota archaeon]